jgi:hypothetical protein
MRDFTFSAYQGYLDVLQSLYPINLRIDEYFALDRKPHSFYIIRHDVDRRPRKALHMARLENARNVRSTYYFRAKSHVFKPDILQAIEGMGHEVGYHYESLSDARGDTQAALRDFEANLARFRQCVHVTTIAAHGSPLSAYDNRDLWRNGERKRRLIKDYGVSGEAYLNIDYSQIAYLTDTGRNWSATRDNLRDRVASTIAPSLQNTEDLLGFLRAGSARKTMFQIHPERWAESFPDYLLCSGMDVAANWIKTLIHKGS